MKPHGRLSRAARHGFGCALCLALLPIASAQSATSGVATDPPQVLFKDLFIAVQTAGMFPDSKEFPDAVPRSAPDDILKQFHADVAAFIKSTESGK